MFDVIWRCALSIVVCYCLLSYVVFDCLLLFVKTCFFFVASLFSFKLFWARVELFCSACRLLYVLVANVGSEA